MRETVRSYKAHAKSIERVKGMRLQLQAKLGSTKVENYHKNLISEARAANSEASWRSRRIVMDSTQLQFTDVIRSAKIMAIERKVARKNLRSELGKGMKYKNYCKFLNNQAKEVKIKWEAKYIQKIKHISRKYKIQEIQESLKTQKRKPKVNLYIKDLPRLNIYTKPSQETSSSGSSLEGEISPLQDRCISSGLVTSTKLDNKTDINVSHPTSYLESDIKPLQEEGGNAHKDVGHDIDKIACDIGNIFETNPKIEIKPLKAGNEDGNNRTSTDIDKNQSEPNVRNKEGIGDHSNTIKVGTVVAKNDPEGKQPLQVIFGDFSINEDERDFLSLPPNTALQSDLNDLIFTTNLEASFTKIRMAKKSERSYNEILQDHEKK